MFLIYCFEVPSRPPQIIARAGQAWKEILSLQGSTWREGRNDPFRLEKGALHCWGGGEGRGLTAEKMSTKIWRLAVLTLIVINLVAGRWSCRLAWTTLHLEPVGGRGSLMTTFLATFLCLLLILCLSFSCCWIRAVECRWRAGHDHDRRLIPHNNHVHI